MAVLNENTFENDQNWFNFIYRDVALNNQKSRKFVNK